MPYCPKCGVEADPSVRSCPLCATAIPVFPELGPGEPAWPEPGLPGDPSKRYYTPAQVRGRTIWTISAVFAAVLATVAGVNLVTSGTAWGLYTLSSLCAAWGLTAAVLAWRNPFIVVPVCFGLISALLASFDFVDGSFGWFPTLGLPLTALPFVLAIGGILLSRLGRGYFSLGIIAALVAVGLAAVDLLVNVWLGKPGLGWSLVTSLVFVPSALVFLFLHYGLRIRIDLKRTFHF